MIYSDNTLLFDALLVKDLPPSSLFLTEISIFLLLKRIRQTKACLTQYKLSLAIQIKE